MADSRARIIAYAGKNALLALLTLLDMGRLCCLKPHLGSASSSTIVGASRTRLEQIEKFSTCTKPYIYSKT